MKNLEDLEVGQLEGSTEFLRIAFEEFDQLEHLSLGGTLHLIDLGKDSQNGLCDGRAFLLATLSLSLLSPLRRLVPWLHIDSNYQ
jgi:hypothetical protein